MGIVPVWEIGHLTEGDFGWFSVKWVFPNNIIWIVVFFDYMCFTS